MSDALTIHEMMTRVDALTVLNAMTDDEKHAALASFVERKFIEVALPLDEVDAHFLLERWVNAWVEEDDERERGHEAPKVRTVRDIIRDHIETMPAHILASIDEEILDLDVDGHCGSVAFHTFLFANDLELEGVASGDNLWHLAVDHVRVCYFG